MIWLDKKSATHKDKSAANTSGVATKCIAISNKQLKDELHKPIFKEFKKLKVAYIRLINKYNKEIQYLLCVIDGFY